MKNRHENIFSSHLSSLGVKHTRLYSNKCYGEHPNKYNLLGLSQMLSECRIENKGIQIKGDKEETFNSLEVLFIAHAGNDFVNVFKITKDKVYYIWRDTTIVTNRNEFIKIWTGVVLLTEPDENSIEPDYKENRKKELITTIQQYLLVVTIAVFASLFYISNRLYTNIGISLLTLINLVGVYVGYLLVLKQMHIQSNYADKICSLFKQSDCNDVLESKAAKLWGIIGWSEIGLSYFISNIIIILFIPSLLRYLVLINICVLPYTVWSVWYQKVKVKQWCPLCLIVQALLWGIFAMNLIFHLILQPTFEFSEILLVGIIYGMPILLLNLFLPKLSHANRIEEITQEINSIKTTNEVFMTLLKKQPYYPVERLTSQIILGNVQAANLITIFTNPHCEPCAKMHTQVEKLLAKQNNNACVQYIFSSFNEGLNESNRFLIATYLTNEQHQARTVYKNWFEGGKYQRDKFFSKYNYQVNDEVQKEFIAHENWKEKTLLRSTPTILVNGYLLPDNYKIEDLYFMINLDVNAQ